MRYLVNTCSLTTVYISSHHKCNCKNIVYIYNFTFDRFAMPRCVKAMLPSGNHTFAVLSLQKHLEFHALLQLKSIYTSNIRHQMNQASEALTCHTTGIIGTMHAFQLIPVTFFCCFIDLKSQLRDLFSKK